MNNKEQLRSLLARKKFTEIPTFLQTILEKLLREDSSSYRDFIDDFKILVHQSNASYFQTSFREIITSKIDQQNWDEVRILMEDLEFFSRMILHLDDYYLIKMNFQEQSGCLFDLRKTILESLDLCWERKIPFVDKKIINLSKKYFHQDLHLKICIFRNQSLYLDEDELDITLKEILQGLLQKKKDHEEKLWRQNLLSILQSLQEDFPLFEIYYDFIVIIFSERSFKIFKKKIKKIIECLIFLKHSDLKLAIWNFLYNHLKREMMTSLLQDEVKKEEIPLSFIKHYYQKLYNLLIREEKSSNFLFQCSENKEILYKSSLENESTALKDMLEKQVMSSHLESKTYDDLEVPMANIGFLDNDQLFDLAISFIHLRMFSSVLKIVRLAQERDLSHENLLKFNYLQALALFEKKDFWGIIYLCMSLKLKTSQDYLAFLYLKGEAFFRLSLRDEARQTFQIIESMDPNYRLTRERLKVLNEF